MSSPASGETRGTKLRWRIPIVILIAAVILTVVVVCAVLGDKVSPIRLSSRGAELGDTPPSASHIAGTDLLGRDILSRVIYGARTAVVGPVVVAAGAFAMATLLGLVSGYLGGLVNSAIMRWVDFMFALPGTLVAIVVVGVLGGGYWTAVVVLIVLFTALTRAS